MTSSDASSPSHERTALLTPAQRRVRLKKRIYEGVALCIGLLTLLVVALACFPRSARQGLENSKPYINLPEPQPGLRNPAYLARGRHGAVATEVKECSHVGLDVLRDGGNAIDAAIAACLCIGVTNSFSSGIGGGGFMVIRPANGQRPISINFRESAPIGAHPNMFANKSWLASKFGGLAVGVPGELRGLEAAYRLHGGRVGWKRLFAPNIRLARSHPIGLTMAARLGKIFSDFIKDDPTWSQVYRQGDRFLRAGELAKNPPLARTLEEISEKGADVFYKGPIAQSIVRAVQEAGGILTEADMASYKAVVAPAIKGSYRNRTIYTSGAPSSGPVLISLLNTLEPISTFVEEGRTGLNVHRFVEALKFAFAHRTEFGDPAYVNNSAKWDEVVTKQFGAQTLKRITDNSTHTLPYYQAKFDLHDDHGTTHLSAVDAEGNAVSLTSTINLVWGSRIMDPVTGVILNDEMDDFATPNVPDAFGLAPSPYNYPEGPRIWGQTGKRPLSSIASVIMEREDGSFWLSLGGSGGSRIFGGVAQVILNLDWGYDLSHAVEEPRVHHQLLPAYVSIESGIQPEIVHSLKTRGHNISMFDINFGICEIQAVERSLNNWFFAASDSRKNGIAAAY